MLKSRPFALVDCHCIDSRRSANNSCLYRFACLEIIAEPIALIGPLARVGILEKLNRTIPRLQSSAAEYLRRRKELF